MAEKNSLLDVLLPPQADGEELLLGNLRELLLRGAGARSIARAVRPQGGRQEGGTTKVLSGYVPKVLGDVASLPARAIEGAREYAEGGEPPVGPALEVALGTMGASLPFRPAGSGVVLGAGAYGPVFGKMKELKAAGFPPEVVNHAFTETLANWKGSPLDQIIAKATEKVIEKAPKKESSMDLSSLVGEPPAGKPTLATPKAWYTGKSHEQIVDELVKLHAVDENAYLTKLKSLPDDVSLAVAGDVGDALASKKPWYQYGDGEFKDPETLADDLLYLESQGEPYKAQYEKKLAALPHDLWKQVLEYMPGGNKESMLGAKATSVPITEEGISSKLASNPGASIFDVAGVDPKKLSAPNYDMEISHVLEALQSGEAKSGVEAIEGLIDAGITSASKTDLLKAWQKYKESHPKPAKAEVALGNPADPLPQYKPKGPSSLEPQLPPEVDAATLELWRGQSPYSTPAFRGIGQPTRQMPSINGNYPQNVSSGYFSAANPELSNLYAMDYGSGQYDMFGVGRRPQTAPLRLDTRDYYVMDAGGKNWGSAQTDAIYAMKKEMEKTGKRYKGVVMHNVWDEPGTKGKLDSPQTVYISLDPGTIRSASAQHNPAKYGQNDLLAGLAGAGLIAPGTVNLLLGEKPEKEEKK